MKREVPRMRTINMAIAEMHKADPHSCVTAHYLRRIVREGLLKKTVRVGEKYLVNLDEVFEFMGGDVNG